MNPFKILWRLLFSSGDDPILDHIPANRLPDDPKQKKKASNMAAAKLAKARAEAAIKHGKQFRCDEIVKRDTEFSDALKKIISKTEVIVEPSTDIVAARRIAGAKKQ